MPSPIQPQSVEVDLFDVKTPCGAELHVEVGTWADDIGVETRVYDEEWDLMFDLPGDIRGPLLVAVFCIQKGAFERGKRHGEWCKANEIRKALDMPEVQP